MSAIMTLFTAMAAAPTCLAAAAVEPVGITSAVLPAHVIGGTYRPGKGWPAPGEARVGYLRYEWGLLLRSDDPRFADFDLSPGPIHSRSSGCWFQWENRLGERGVEAIAAPHIGKSGYNSGYTPEQPTNPPSVPGYRFVTADKAYSTDHAWIGLWNAADGTGRSQVVAFTNRRHTSLAAFPFRLGGLATMPSPDTAALGMTIVGEGKSREPVPYFRLVASSGVRVALPYRDLAALAAEIERAVVMPNGAQPIGAYGRNYALTGVGSVIGRYLLAIPRQQARGCAWLSSSGHMRDCTEADVAELQKKYDASFARATPAGASRWFDDPADVPIMSDGHCMQVNVEYDLATRKVVAVSCNGSA